MGRSGKIGPAWSLSVVTTERRRRLGLQIVLTHQAAQLLAVHHDALVTQGGTYAAATAIAIELVADGADPGEDLAGIQH